MPKRMPKHMSKRGCTAMLVLGAEPTRRACGKESRRPCVEQAQRRQRRQRWGPQKRRRERGQSRCASSSVASMSRFRRPPTAASWCAPINNACLQEPHIQHYLQEQLLIPPVHPVGTTDQCCLLMSHINNTCQYLRRTRLIDAIY